MEFIGILCLNYNNTIGYKEKNDLIFDIKEEIKNFKNITLDCVPDKTNVLIMGRNTWDSIKYKPLKDRMNFIISSNYESINYEYREKHNVISFPNNETCLNYIYDNKNIYDKVFIIGGISIYEYYLNNNIITKIYCTKITTPNNFGDIYFNINYFNFFKINKLIEYSYIDAYNKINNNYEKLNYITITYNKFSKIDINIIYNINKLTKNFNEDLDDSSDNTDDSDNINLKDSIISNIEQYKTNLVEDLSFYISSDENESINDNNESINDIHNLAHTDSWTIINNDQDDITLYNREKINTQVIYSKNNCKEDSDSDSDSDKTYYF